jgi:hypothetical protein
MKSKAIGLVLITSLLASCHKEEPNWGEQDVYMRGDSTAVYTHSHNNNALLWYMAFRPYGLYNNGIYSHAGMYSNSISHSSNVGRSSFKASSSSRGGFGSSSHGSSAS